MMISWNGQRAHRIALGEIYLKQCVEAKPMFKDVV